MSHATLHIGDVFDVLATIPDHFVDLVLTSPPFLALRSYLPADHPDKAKEIGSEPTPADAKPQPEKESKHMPLSAPATPSGFDFKDHNGALLLFTVHSHEHGISTSFGEKDAVSADIAVLDGPHKGDEYPAALVFPRVLISQLAPNVGNQVIGRLGQGVAKPGQAAPWRLDDATPEDYAVGEKYLAYKQSQQVTTPAAAEPASQDPF